MTMIFFSCLMPSAASFSCLNSGMANASCFLAASDGGSQPVSALVR